MAVSCNMLIFWVRVISPLTLAKSVVLGFIQETFLRTVMCMDSCTFLLT